MEQLTEEYLYRLVRTLQFPPLEFNVLEEIPESQSKYSSRKLRGDFIAEIKWEKKSYKFVAELIAQATPKVIDNLIYRLREYVSAAQNYNGSQFYYPLLIAPYFNEQTLEQFASEKISGIDLSGNGVVIVPGKLFVHRFGEKNKFPSNAPIKNVFRGVSSIVPRVFFAKPEYANATEILDEIMKRNGKTTLSTVSKVLKTLEEELLISRKAGIRLIEGKKLLKNLRDNFQRPKIERKVIGKAEDLNNVLAKFSANAKENDFLYAIDKPRRYAVIGSAASTTRVYTEDIAQSLFELSFSETSRFPNVEIIQTSDPTVYFDRRYEVAANTYCTSPLQVYLELANGGKREKEIAEQIEEGLLNFRY